MTQTTHAPTPHVAAEVFDAVAQVAEQHPAARMVVLHDPEINAALIARTKTGYVEFWNLIAPMSEEATRVILAEEVERGNATEDEIVFLKMAEVAPEHQRLN